MLSGRHIKVKHIMGYIISFPGKRSSSKNNSPSGTHQENLLAFIHSKQSVLLKIYQSVAAADDVAVDSMGIYHI